MKISIPLDVVPQSRPRFFNGRAYDPPKCKQFKKDFSALIKEKIGESALSENALKVEVQIFRQASKFQKGIVSRRYGDIDNLAKGILDALNGILWKDDSQIVCLNVSKLLADSPRIDLSVDEV